ncbi:hypothetical protein [Streptomyces antimycoticus]|uniref:hypothetical protein n=1 Tax=Streptomyces antimycoticus TaxID=68175 RepID=UPI0036E1DB91|nr:hypothetical protein OG751_04275 [Streptomyces antimycoticus]
MASVHKHKQRVLRGIDDDLAAEFDAFARQLGGDRSSITRQLWEWCVGRPGAELPQRPEPAEDPTHPDA